MMASQNGDSSNQDFELNLASIIDCFTVLITYLLVTVSFISLGAFDILVPVPSAEDSPPSPPTVSLTIELHANGELAIREEGLEKRYTHLPAARDYWDIDQLILFLKNIKLRHPDLDSAMITGEDFIKYRDIIKIIEASKTILPKIAISPNMESV